MVDRALTATVFSCDVERPVPNCPSVGYISYERCHRGSCRASFSFFKTLQLTEVEEERIFLGNVLKYEGNSLIEPAADLDQLQVSVELSTIIFCPAAGIQGAL